MNNLNITVNRRWSTSRVREVCLENDLYTCGDNEEYEHMLSWVKRLYPNVENLHFIAENICKHSKEQRNESKRCFGNLGWMEFARYL